MADNKVADLPTKNAVAAEPAKSLAGTIQQVMTKASLWFKSPSCHSDKSFLVHFQVWLTVRRRQSDRGRLGNGTNLESF